MSKKDYDPNVKILSIVSKNDYDPNVKALGIVSKIDYDSNVKAKGVVPKNDYGPNIKGLGIVSNCRIIKNIAAGPIDKMLKEYVRQANLKVGHPVDKSIFDASRRIFSDQQDILLVPPPVVSNSVFTNLAREFTRIKAIRVTVSRQAQAGQTGTSFYVRKGSRRNQFWHLFTSKDTILHKRKEVDLSKVRRHPHPPAPSKGPTTKRRKRVVKKKQKTTKKDCEENQRCAARPT